MTEHVIGPAAARGENPALIDGVSGEVTTYAELASEVDRVAAGLQEEGIGKGDVVALIGPNSADWAIGYHGILRAGAVVTPINPLLTEDEVGKQLADSKAKKMIKPEDVPGIGEPGATPADVEID